VFHLDLQDAWASLRFERGRLQDVRLQLQGGSSQTQEEKAGRFSILHVMRASTQGAVASGRSAGCARLARRHDPSQRLFEGAEGGGSSAPPDEPRTPCGVAVTRSAAWRSAVDPEERRSGCD
jgi:hypothetical protein